MKPRSFLAGLAIAPALLLSTCAMAQLAAEQLPGGGASHTKTHAKKLLSEPAASMPRSEKLNFVLGRAIFEKIWVSSPSSTTASDGLGPLFNARSCLACHINNGRGHAPEADWPEDNAMSMLMRLSIPAQNEQQRRDLMDRKVASINEPNYGGQLQDFAVPGLEAEGQLHLRFTELPIALSEGETASLRVPEYRITGLQYGELHADLMMSPRIATQISGLGLLEALSEQQILAAEDPNDSDGDGISGRANRVWDLVKQQPVVGRFGWKAGNPTLAQQNSAAFNGDIGISTQLFSTASGDCTANQPRCLSAPHGNSEHLDGLEASIEMSKVLETYTRYLALPVRRNAMDAEVLAGKQVFSDTGCASCHTPSFTTPKDAPEGLAGQKIWPYSDLLLHDMGPGLADGRPEYAASGTEWRTAPLWGIGIAKKVDPKAGFLHDGRARNLLEAVLWHGGEAQAARDKVVNMPASERAKLLRFLESL